MPRRPLTPKPALGEAPNAEFEALSGMLLPPLPSGAHRGGRPGLHVGKVETLESKADLNRKVGSEEWEPRFYVNGKRGPGTLVQPDPTEALERSYLADLADLEHQAAGRHPVREARREKKTAPLAKGRESAVHQQAEKARRVREKVREKFHALKGKPVHNRATLIAQSLGLTEGAVRKHLRALSRIDNKL